MTAMSKGIEQNPISQTLPAAHVASQSSLIKSRDSKCTEYAHTDKQKLSQKSKSISTRAASFSGKSEALRRPTSQFLTSSRLPYSYVKPAEAPPPNLYRPSFASVDPNATHTDFYAREALPQTDIRHSTKPLPSCQQKFPHKCCLSARKLISYTQRPRSAVPGSANKIGNKKGSLKTGTGTGPGPEGENLFVTGLSQQPSETKASQKLLRNPSDDQVAAVTEKEQFSFGQTIGK